MLKLTSFFSCLFLTISIGAQDAYHTELLQSLADEYGLENGVPVLNDTEAANVADIGIYGNVTHSTSTVNNANYTLVTNVKVNAAGNNAWDSGMNVRSNVALQAGDVVLYTFVAKSISSSSELFIFAERSSDFEKETYTELILEPDWNTYYLPIKLGSSYAANQFTMGFHMAGLAQEFQIAGYTAINYGDAYELEQFPASFSSGAYEGIEADAPWRATAADRIESLRKADLSVRVVDEQGTVVPGAAVEIEMLEHEFGFGSAFVTCRFAGNDCSDNTYVQKLLDLDGKGHGFNVGVTENALKWDGWEEEWLGSPAETASAVKFLVDNGIDMRGHTLFWPGYNLMPDDIQANRTDLAYVRERIDGRINTMLNHPILGDIVTEWDVLNEITQNRDLEAIFDADPNFDTGREIYQEIFRKVKATKPDTKIYVNDYVVLSGGGSATSVVNRYKQFLDELHASDVEWEGIGFQAHIGAQPTSLTKVENTLDEFTAAYGKRIKITEYDISPNVSDEIQASYMSDFLTLVFSHPSVEAFIMWGFWDGNHWKGSAPMYDINWGLKPSGQAFIDKVFDEWWTEASGTTGADGSSTFRGFKGAYKITVTAPDGQVVESVATLDANKEVQVSITGTVATADLKADRFSIFPNPAKGHITVTKRSALPATVELMTIAGAVLRTYQSQQDSLVIPLADIKQQYILVRVTDAESSKVERIMIVE